MRTSIITILLTLFALCAVANAAPVNCMTAAATNPNVLTLTMGCFLDDLLFDQFSVTPTPSATVFLSSLGTGVVSGGANLGFQITTPAPPSDTILMYRVSTLSGARIINGVDNAQSGSGGTRIQELVCSVPLVAAECAPANQLANFANPPTTMATFAPQSQVYIMKDISLPNANSFISSFVNSHETTIPEPSTALLLGFGLLSVAGVSRRLRRG